jgi:hypothetical protein
MTEQPECSNCYAPLKEHESGTCDRCKHYAGFYHVDIAYNPETDCMDLRKVKITCPVCSREFAPLLSKFTEPIRHYFLDLDCEMPAVEMKTFCRKCKSDITFKLDCG